jgi:hypothetical protein
MSAVKFGVTPYFTSAPTSPMSRFAIARVDARAPLALAMAYGLTSMFFDSGGTVRPTMCAARDAMWIPPCPCAFGVGARKDSSFFHLLVRKALNPQTCVSPGP